MSNGAMEKPVSEEIEPPHAQAYYRISSDPEYGSKNRPPQGVLDAINFENTEAPDSLLVEVDNRQWLIWHTSPVKHVYVGGQPMLVDVVIVADSAGSLEQEVSRVTRASETIKQRYLIYMAEVLIPELSEIHHIVGAMGRGDVFNQGRLSTKASDLDIVLFVDFSLSDKTALSQFLGDLEGVSSSFDGDQFTLAYNAHNSQSGEVPNREIDFTTPASPVGCVTFDVVSLPDVKAAIEATPDIFKKMGDYIVHAFTQGPVLIDSERRDVKDLKDSLKELAK